MTPRRGAVRSLARVSLAHRFAYRDPAGTGTRAGCNMASLATPAVAGRGPGGGGGVGGSPSPPSPESLPELSSQQQSISLNGRGSDLPVRPGTALGSSHFASPPNSASPAATRAPIDYASLPRWDDAQVATWLANALPTLASKNDYAATFAENDIRGSVLLEVDQTALKEMGVKSVGDRVKICVAVRALRAKYNSATTAAAATGAGGATTLARRPSTLGRMAPSPLQSRLPYSPGSVPSSASSPLSATVPQPSISSLRPGSTSLSYSARNISVGNRIPPPLHLAQSNVMSGATTINGSAANQLSPPSATTSPKSATFMTTAASLAGGGEQALATSPLRMLQAPTSSSGMTTAHPVSGRVPPTPTTTTTLPSPSRAAAHLETSPILAQAPQQYQNQGLTTSLSASSLASRPPQTYGSGHRKASSSSVPAPVSVGGGGGGAAAAATNARPPFAGQAVSYAGHPYAASATSSAASTATASSFASAGSTISSASTTTSSLLPSALPALPPRFASAPALPVSSSPASAAAATNANTPLSNLDVMRKAVKFTSADGVTTRVLAVADARDGREVLARVMKKFGGRDGEDLDGWGVWTTEVTGAGTYDQSLPACNCKGGANANGLIANSPTIDGTRAVPDLPERGGSGAYARPHRAPASHAAEQPVDIAARDARAHVLLDADFSSPVTRFFLLAFGVHS